MAWQQKDRLSDSPDVVDRGVVLACAATWLLALGVAVAAGVALVDLGNGGTTAEAVEEPATPWLLYSVIGVSALVIALAIPLLLRARRTAEEPPPPPRTGPKTVQARAMMVDADPPDYPGPTPARYSSSVISAAALDRMWLRCGLGVLTGLGLAYVAVAVATYLMALDKLTASWIVYGVAGALTVVMIAIPIVYLRQLRAALAGEG